jgi:integrase
VTRPNITLHRIAAWGAMRMSLKSLAWAARGELRALNFEELSKKRKKCTVRKRRKKRHSRVFLPNKECVNVLAGHVFLWKGKPMTEGWKTAFHAACRRPGIVNLHFHDLRHTFVTRKMREDWSYKHIMAITGHKTLATSPRYNNLTEEDSKAVVLANSNSPKKMIG